jgi:hypothetical protein
LISEELPVQVSETGGFSAEESGLLADASSSGKVREKTRRRTHLINQRYLMLPSLGHDPDIRGSK